MSSLVVIITHFSMTHLFVNRLRMMLSLNTATQAMFFRDWMMTVTMYVLYMISMFFAINMVCTDPGKSWNLNSWLNNFCYSFFSDF